jgi:2-oxoglutarate dehydrogenase E1 component
MVCLLPHGYEGQGPEHSSARIERFLELCGNLNMQVVYPTTAAQCFHMFRRQLIRDFRKPLIVMTPKSMLRTPTSKIEHLTHGHFQEIIDDPFFNREETPRSNVKRIALCVGKVYWDLDARRRELGYDGVAIVRIEQPYPFHSELLREVIARYPEGAEIVWVQEEPRNMGCFGFMLDQIQSRLDINSLPYIGRPASGTPAVGSKRVHKIEQERIVTLAVGPKPESNEAEDEKADKKAAETGAPKSGSANGKSSATPKSTKRNGKAVSTK